MIELIEFKKSELLDNNEKTFDLTVEDNHSYVINDIIVHNSACMTRHQTGVGRPQLSTIIECADAAHGVGGMICADGGITCAGDLCKAFGAGADFVMLGGMYAGTDEAEGEVIQKVYKNNEIIPVTCNDGLNDAISALDVNDLSKVNITEYKNQFNVKKYKLFYGMSSEYNQNVHHNGMAKYRASEGRVVEVPYVGSVDKVNAELLGGLRSCMTYIGARRLKDIPKCCTFYRVNNQLNKVFEQYTKE